MFNKNNTGTSQVGAIPKAQKISFKNMLRTFLMKHSQKVSKTPKGARKTLQKFRYSVLRQIRALLSILRLLLSKTQITSDITSQVRI